MRSAIEMSRTWLVILECIEWLDLNTHTHIFVLEESILKNFRLRCHLIG